jgi:hypothetical protein
MRCSLLGVLGVPAVHAARLIHSRAHVTGSSVTMRKRLHVNNLITEPGTAEIDFGGLYSWTTGEFTLPGALKCTPDGPRLFWGRTEYSASFDTIDSAAITGGRLTQFSDRLTLASTSVIFDSPHFDIAAGPQVSLLLRGDSGIRAGAALVARYDNQRTSVGATVSWTAGTQPSDTNPAGVWDFGVGFGRSIASSGAFGRLTPHVNIVAEKSTGFQRTLSGFAGVEYQATERLAIDLSGQRFNWNSGVPDRQVLLSLTINLGQLR